MFPFNFTGHLPFDPATGRRLDLDRGLQVGHEAARRLPGPQVLERYRTRCRASRIPLFYSRLLIRTEILILFSSLLFFLLSLIPLLSLPLD
jgi:hypothetical protein